MRQASNASAPRGVAGSRSSACHKADPRSFKPSGMIIRHPDYALLRVAQVARFSTRGDYGPSTGAGPRRQGEGVPARYPTLDLALSLTVTTALRS